MKAALRESASPYVWALVSGFRGDQRRNRLLLMLQAYIDESIHRDMFVMAGYIAPSEVWAAFSDEWKGVLDTRSPHYKILQAFKMRDLTRTSVADMEQCAWFYDVIEKNVKAAISVHFPISALRNALARLPMRERISGIEKLENPYYFGFRAIIDMLIQNQVKLGLNAPIDFIFDERTEDLKCIEGWKRMKEGATGERAKLMGDLPIFQSDAKVLPLQAADLWAGWVRVWTTTDIGISTGIQQLSFPWKVKRPDLPRLALWWDENGLFDNLVKLFTAEIADVERETVMAYKRRWRWVC